MPVTLPASLWHVFKNVFERDFRHGTGFARTSGRGKGKTRLRGAQSNGFRQVVINGGQHAALGFRRKVAVFVHGKERAGRDTDFLSPSGHASELVDRRVRLDCNQGLDARLIAVDDALARLLSRVRWSKSIRLACDHKSQMPAVESSVKAIRRHGGKRYNFSCYVLVQDVEDALERIEFLRSLGVDPFAQPYREPGSKKVPAQNLRRLARWVNHKAIFKSIPWVKYRGSAA